MPRGKVKTLKEGRDPCWKIRDRQVAAFVKVKDIVKDSIVRYEGEGWSFRWSGGMFMAQRNGTKVVGISRTEVISQLNQMRRLQVA